MHLTPLRPVSSWLDVCAPEKTYPAPERSPVCQHPACHGRSQERHHVIARGWLHAALDWVLIRGELVRNVMDLCTEHHGMLESRPGGCRSRLRWIDGTGWAWYDRYNPATDATREAVWWTDQDRQTLWRLIGFAKGGRETWILNEEAA